tara:strand:- start:1647 stop:2702 length:1056 start_codon:yes stop_codon:yes gene_type:complete
MKHIKIDGTSIGEGYSPYIVAELSGNHNGDINRAKKIIELSKRSGANAVKLQTFKPDSITLPSNRKEFLINQGIWAGQTLYELYTKTCLPYEWHEELFAFAKNLGITLFSSPFSEKDVEFLETFDVPAYKVASNELTHLPLVAEIIKTGKPIILSTGTASLEEIALVVNFLEKNGCENYILLHCISAYPAPLTESCIANVQAIKKHFKCLVGLSDHSLGIVAPIVAVSLGACFIEKHVTLKRNDGGSDSSFSLEPDELEQLCISTKSAYQSIGEPSFGYKECEKKSPIFKRYYYAKCDIQSGETLNMDNIIAVRSPEGIPSRDYKTVMGAIARNTIQKHTPIVYEDLTFNE